MHNYEGFWHGPKLNLKVQPEVIRADVLIRPMQTEVKLLMVDSNVLTVNAKIAFKDKSLRCKAIEIAGIHSQQ